MKIFFFLSLLQFGLVSAWAQSDMEPPVSGADMPTIKTSISRLYGKVLDNRSGKGVTAASVQLLAMPQDSAAMLNKDSMLRGMLTRPNGDFSFENIQANGNILVRISAIGYETEERTVSFSEGRGNGSVEKDLGNISLNPEIKKMDDVTIVSKAPGLIMGIDRKIFTADKILTSAGGTAVDIMKNIPSVSVDIEGNVELRNSTPQIFVDGSPTILTLDQIPADHVERIELITNPSAKFDAASSGGIINVVLKKNKRIGMNGLATLSGGTPELFSSNLNLNLRQGKFNFFVSGGYNQSGGRAKGQTLRQNIEDGSINDYFNQYTLNERSRKFSSIRFGVDYAMDNRNTLTVSQNFVKGRFENNELQDQEYLNRDKILEYYGKRDTDGKFGFNRSSTRLNYKHNFPKTGQELLADFGYNYGTRSGNNNIINTYFTPGGTPYQDAAIVRNEGDNNETQVTLQIDYTNPVTERNKIETGIRSFRNKFGNTYAAYARNNGEETKLPLNNNYEYTETVHAAYVTFSSKSKSEKFSYQLGLRTEYSKFDGVLVDSAFKFGYEYPDNIGKIWNALFPSFFLSKKVDENNELQFNYSRRIRRPRFWQLNPFIDINDPVNLRQGNPQLRPEFINSFEFNYNRKYKAGNFLGVLYFRNNPDDITEYSDTITAAQYQQLNNAAVDPNAIVNTFINASTTNRYGAEFTLQHNFGKNFEIMPTVDLQYRTVNANVKELNLSNKGFNWEAKLMLNYKTETTKSPIFTNLGFQLTGEYESPRVIPQGRQIEQFNVDLALRKDFLKNKKATITFAVNDLFNSRRWGTIYDTERFYQDSYRRWNVRNFRLSFSYKFGDANFSFGKRGGNRGGGDED
jgi:outer membrane receptor protein involved in Fe transport